MTMYKTMARPTRPPPTPIPLTLPRRSDEILPVTTPIEMLPTSMTRQEQAELTAITFWMSAGDHFFVIARSQKLSWGRYSIVNDGQLKEYISFDGAGVKKWG